MKSFSFKSPLALKESSMAPCNDMGEWTNESEVSNMEYRCKVTVLDKKLYPELQQQYCAVPDSGKCACYNVGDEFMFYRNDERDDYWHMGAGTLVKSGQPDEGMLISPGAGGFVAC